MRTGVRTTTRSVTVVRQENDTGLTRVGIVVGRKLGNAVARNRAKRRIRAAVHLASLSPSYDYVIVPNPRIADMPFEALVSAIAGADPVEKRDV